MMSAPNVWTVALTFRTPEEKDEIKQAIDRLADLDLRSVSAYIRNLVIEHVRAEEENLRDSR